MLKTRVPGRNTRNKLIATRVMNIRHISSKMRLATEGSNNGRKKLLTTVEKTCKKEEKILQKQQLIATTEQL